MMCYLPSRNTITIVMPIKLVGVFFTKNIKTSTYLYLINTFGTSKNQFINKQKGQKIIKKTQN
jgi:hypothetical protein